MNILEVYPFSTSLFVIEISSKGFSQWKMA